MKLFSLKPHLLLFITLIFSSFFSSAFDLKLGQNRFDLKISCLFSDSTKQTFSYSISNEVTEESGLQIKKYMLERTGVYSCTVNLIDRMLVLETDSESDYQLMLQLVRYAEHLYVVHKD